MISGSKRTVNPWLRRCRKRNSAPHREDVETEVISTHARSTCMDQQWLYRVIGATLLALSAAGCAYGKGQRAVTPPPQSGPNAVAAVDAFEAAIVKGDETTAKMLLAPDVLIYESGGQEASRDEYAARHMKGDMAFLAGSKREVLSRADGGDSEHAWVATRSRITGRHRDRDVDIISTQSMMLKHTSEGWRIVHIHWSSRPASKDH